MKWTDCFKFVLIEDHELLFDEDKEPVFNYFADQISVDQHLDLIDFYYGLSGPESLVPIISHLSKRAMDENQTICFLKQTIVSIARMPGDYGETILPQLRLSIEGKNQFIKWAKNQEKENNWLRELIRNGSLDEMIGLIPTV